jgi:hypothetical protein
VTRSAEQAVNVPLHPLQESGDSAKLDDNSVSSIFPVSYRFHMILPDFLHSEYAPALRITAGRVLSAHLRTDHCTETGDRRTVNLNLEHLSFNSQHDQVAGLCTNRPVLPTGKL